MCLEDRVLLALYDQPGYIPLPDLADRVSLTENALLSIVHRIAADRPDFLLQQGDETALMFSANTQTEAAVKTFVANGGYTAINEEEFRKYFTEELSLYNRLQRFKEDVAQKEWIKWTGIAALSIAAGIGVTAYLRSRKKTTSI